MTQLTIERLSHEGRGLARHHGKVAFIAGALAGEIVNAELVKRHRRHDEYRLIDVLEPAPERVEPPCPLVGRCGGCDLQHLAEPAQISHKTRALLEQIRRQSGLAPGTLLPPLATGAFAYRRRARLAVDVPRRGGRPVIGLRMGGGGSVVSIDHCPVLAPELAVLPGRLQQLASDLERPEALGHVELSLAETIDALLPVIYLRMVADPTAGDRLTLREFAALETAYLALKVGDGPIEYLHRPSSGNPQYRLPEFDLSLGYLPGGFVQGNAAVNRELVCQVVEWMTTVEGARVLDAFCGVGNFALPLARRGCEVLGLEASAEVVALARENAATNGVGSASFEVRDLFGDARSLRLPAVDTAVIDPPRAGARALVAALADAGVANVVYVSCAPATLARDAAILADAGYQLECLRLVDMFPQTSHIESASLFRLDRRGKRRRPGAAHGERQSM